MNVIIRINARDRRALNDEGNRDEDFFAKEIRQFAVGARRGSRGKLEFIKYLLSDLLGTRFEHG